MFQNVPIEGSCKQNRGTLLAGMKRLARLGVTASDFQRATQITSRSGYVQMYAFATAKEVAERLQYPRKWAAFDTDIINVLIHLLTDLIGCGALQEILENEELGNFLVDGSMGLPSPELELEKRIREILANRPRDNREKRKVNQNQDNDKFTSENKIHSKETEISNKGILNKANDANDLLIII